jgi:hypothetical protein
MGQQAAAGSGVTVPDELVGTWHYNWVSWINQQDPTGHWLPPTAFDITFVFGAEGWFELRDFRQASNWCTLTTYETAGGRFEVDDVDITLYPIRGHIISQSNCRQDWNYERDTDGGAPGTIQWRWGRDALGGPALVLAWPQGEENAYVPEPGGVATAPHGDRVDVLDRPSG